MSIANKLIYLNTTKEKLKDSINNIGGSITDETTFRAYATELDNIYTNLPKTTGEGSNLSLSTLKGRINVDDILGDTQQDTTNGYQLADLTLAKLKTYNTSGTWNNNVYTISGVTITINDDMSIKVNGTTTAQVGLLLAGGAIPYPTGTYYLSGAINGSNTTYDVRIFNYDGTSAVAQCFTGTKQVAIVNNSQSFNMAVIVKSGVTCNNVMFYPMLSTTNTSDYEPYTNGASPNPTYPQDINVVTGTQEIVVSNSDNTQSQTKTLHLGDIELAKIGTYQDRIYKNNDKWYVGKNNIEKDKDYLVAQVGQVDTITDYARIRVYLNNACISTPTGLCSHLKFEASYSGQSNHFYTQGNYAYLIVDKHLLSTIDVTGAKAYLNTLTGLKILYPLATPTYEEITNETLLEELNELEKMMSYNGQTNISVTGSLPMLLSVSALKGE